MKNDHSKWHKFRSLPDATGALYSAVQNVVEREAEYGRTGAGYLHYGKDHGLGFGAKRLFLRKKLSYPH